MVSYMILSITLLGGERVIWPKNLVREYEKNLLLVVLGVIGLVNLDFLLGLLVDYRILLSQKMEAMEICQEATQFEDLPNEMILRILEYFPAKDVSKNRLVCKRVDGIVNRNGMKLQRCPGKVEICASQKGVRVKISSLSAKNEVKHSYDHNDALFPALSLVEVVELSIIFEDQACQRVFEKLLQNLAYFKHHKIRSFYLENAILIDEVLCHRLYDLLAQKSIQDITFKNCHIPIGLHVSQISKMENLCQIKILDSSCKLLSESANLCLKKFVYDTRFKPKRSIPFVVEAPTAGPEAVCQFMKIWLEIGENNFFNIKLYGINEDWKDDFLHECQNLRLGHVNFEFPSRSRNAGHIKVKFHPDNSCVEIYPIIDLPARAPGQYICYARYFRDF